jgi:hypothetical protein
MLRKSGDVPNRIALVNQPIKIGVGGFAGACIIKLITAIIFGFSNKLVFVPKH